MTTTPALSVAFVVKLVAKSETAEEVAGFLAGAVELANAEAGTIVWFALRTGTTTVWIVAAFPDRPARPAHTAGPRWDGRPTRATGLALSPSPGQ